MERGEFGPPPVLRTTTVCLCVEIIGMTNAVCRPNSQPAMSTATDRCRIRDAQQTFSATIVTLFTNTQKLSTDTSGLAKRSITIRALAHSAGCLTDAAAW